jgi:hypothetical protein
MARYLFVAMGEVKTQAQIDAMSAPVRIMAVLVAAPFGLAWVAWAVVLGVLFRSGWTYRQLAQLIGVSLPGLLRAVRRSALVCGLTLLGPLAVLAWQAAGTVPAILQLLVAALSSLLLWLAAIVLVQHELAVECALAGRKAMALLTKSF